MTWVRKAGAGRAEPEKVVVRCPCSWEGRKESPGSRHAGRELPAGDCSEGLQEDGEGGNGHSRALGVWTGHRGTGGESWWWRWTGTERSAVCVLMTTPRGGQHCSVGLSQSSKGPRCLPFMGRGTAGTTQGRAEPLTSSGDGLVEGPCSLSPCCSCGCCCVFTRSLCSQAGQGSYAA